ncbi:hypothetical protein BGZ73_000132, partial [Actinomortierella ambigua]
MLPNKALPARPVVQRSAYFTLDQDTLRSVRCDCPSHLDRPLPPTPRRRPTIKTTPPSRAVPPAKRKIASSSPCLPRRTRKSPRTRSEQSEERRTRLATCSHVANSQLPASRATRDKMASSSLSPPPPITTKSASKKEDSHEQQGQTVGYNRADDDDNDDKEEEHGCTNNNDTSAATIPSSSFISLSAQCHQMLSPVSPSLTSLHHDEDEEKGDDKDEDKDKEGILCLIEDSMVVVDLRFMINGTQIDLQHNDFSRGNIVNGIFAPEFWKPYCVSSIEDLGFHSVDGPSGESGGATSRQAALHFCSNTIPSSKTGTLLLSSIDNNSSTTITNRISNAKIARRSISVLSLLGLQIWFCWTTDTPDLLRQRLSQSYWSPLICPERLAITTAMNIIAKDVLEKDCPLVFCAKEIKVNMNRKQMLEKRYGFDKSVDLYQLVVMALESAILSSTVRPQRAPRPARPINTTAKAPKDAPGRTRLDNSSVTKAPTTNAPAPPKLAPVPVGAPTANEPTKR